MRYSRDFRARQPGGRRTLTQQLLSALGRYPGSSLYVHGAGVVSGIQAGNWLFSNATTAATVDNPVGRVDDVRGGVPALQDTTQKKVTLRRGLVNLLPYSHDFGNAAWPAAFTRTLSAGIGLGGSDAWKITGTATASVFSRPYTATSTTLSIACVHKSGTWNPNGGFIIRNSTTSTNLTSTVTTVDLGNGWTLRTLTARTGISVGDIMLLYYGATTLVPNGQFWYLQSAAVFNGAVTAQQIIGAGGIPTTTAAPASSATGPWAHQFDGADDSFGTTLTPGNAGFVCVGANFYDNSLRTILGAGAGSPTGDPGVWVMLNGANLGLYVSDGAARQIVSTAYPGATNAVASAGWSADSMLVGANNTEATAAKTLNCATASKQMAIGMMTAAGSTAGMLGTLGGAMIIVPALPTPADRALMRKWVGNVYGVTL